MNSSRRASKQNHENSCSAAESGKVSRREHQRSFGQFEQLEDKRCLAFLGFFDGVTLDVVQTSDDGDILLENIDDIWRATDNSGVFSFPDAQNVRVELLPETANRIDVQIETDHSGNLELNLGDGAREVFFTGLLNQIGGDLGITAGAGDQSVNLSVDGAAPLIVNGSGNIALGEGFDALESTAQLVTVIGDLDISGVNDLQYTLQVGDPFVIPVIVSDLTIDSTVEDLEVSLVPVGGSTVTGDFNFTGGVNIDQLDLTGVQVGENLNADLGDGQPFFGTAQSLIFNGSVSGDIIIAAGGSSLGNEINLAGVFDGNIVSFTGSDLVDNVVYNLTGTQADVFIDLGAGDDTFQLDTPVNQLEVDFGNNLGDTFIKNVTPVNFEVDLLNFHFFDYVYTALDDRLVVTQLADTGNIVISNDGGASGFDWQTLTGLGTEASTVNASNIEVFLLPDTGNNLELDLINPVIATIDIKLGDGDRAVQFTGISNNPLRDITIEGGAGDQTVDLSVNAPLGVASLVIDLGAGFDTVGANSQPLSIDEDLVFRGVNSFVHDGIVTVFRDTIIDTTGESLDSIFAVDGGFTGGASFTYNGGDGADQIRLNGPGGARVQLATTINLGDSVNGTEQFVLLDSAGTDLSSSLSVTSTNALSTDTFLSGAGANFDGDIDIDLGDGTNNAVIAGAFAGNNAAYVGGDQIDTVSYGLSGNPANVVISLFDGDDSVELLPGSTIASPLLIDFGVGNDTFNNLLGPLDFDATLLGLQGFNHQFVAATNTLISTHVQDLGDVVFDNSDASGTISVTAGGSVSLLAPVNNLNINIADKTSANLIVDLDNSLLGNLNVNLGDGDRTLSLPGDSNSVIGNLTIIAGAGDQTVDVAGDSFVGGFLQIDLGTDTDSVLVSADNLIVGGSTILQGVNTFENSNSINIGGNFTFDVSAESVNTVLSDGTPLVVEGNFNFVGSDADDSILLAPTTVILGNISIDAGNGTNNANLINLFQGTTISYSGGNGVDTVNFDSHPAQALLTVSLGAGDDVFVLGANSALAQPLTIDFGTGNDTFTNNLGLLDFDVELSGLNGFDHSFNFGLSTLTSTQVEALGDVLFDNAGTDSAFQISVDGSTSVLAPADNLSVTLLDNAPGDFQVDLQNAHNGNVNLNLGAGDRALQVSGAAATIGGNLDVTALAGAQTVNVSADVTGNIGINLGNGQNVATLLGSVEGSVNYVGGDDADTLNFEMGGTPSSVTAFFGAGDDTFQLEATAEVSSLLVDFGTGNDTFINNLGALSFPTQLIGLGGFNHSFNPLLETLTSVQTETVNGAITFDTNGTSNAVRVFSSAFSEFGPIANLDITLLDGSQNGLIIDLDNPLEGDLAIDLGAGGRFVSLTGSDNSIGGTLSITASSGSQAVNTSPTAQLSVATDTTIDLGTGLDSINTASAGILVGGDLNLNGINNIAFSGPASVGGNLNIDSSFEDQASSLDAAMLDLAGELNYLGGGSNDLVTISSDSSIGGDIEIRSGAGSNTAEIFGDFGGTDIDYFGGTGSDFVSLGTTGNDAAANIRLNSGSDQFTLEAGADVATNSLRVDFGGGGNDQFVNNFGDFDFNAQLLDLDGYNLFFNAVVNNIDLLQVSDTGNLVIDNNGTGGAFRFGSGDGPFNEISNYNALRVILLDNTSTNLTVDFDNAPTNPGSTVLQLRDGNRNVDFTGLANRFDGLLRIEASDGIQNVNLAVNAPLEVNGTVIVNTRDGNDSVLANAPLNVDVALLLRGVNNFANNAGINIGGDFNIITLLEDQNTTLTSTTDFVVAGNLTYIGGGGVDTINFNSTGADIGGFTYVDLGTASQAGGQQTLLLTGGFSTDSIVVDGGSSVAGNVFQTDASTLVRGGDVIVNFASSTTANTAIFQGTYQGTYATYRGGTSVDLITTGFTAPILEFALLAGAGGDTLIIQNTTEVDFFFGNLGGGQDTLDNQFDGDLPFDNNIFNI